MKEYNLEGQICGTVTTTVFANSLEEAIEIANERDIEQPYYGAENQDRVVWVMDVNNTGVIDIEEK